MQSTIFVILAAAVLALLSRMPRVGLALDPWLRSHQKRSLRELPVRAPLKDQVFAERMRVRATSEFVVGTVRERVAEAAATLLGSPVGGEVIYPQDRIVADLGIGAGPDLEDTALIVALEQDLTITLPDEETKRVFTVEDLIHLCESRLGPPPPRQAQT